MENWLIADDLDGRPQLKRESEASSNNSGLDVFYDWLRLWLRSFSIMYLKCRTADSTIVIRIHIAPLEITFLA
ncbi:MAG: hypothetical protein ACJ07L_17820, partial [Opitutales bacterium]